MAFLCPLSLWYSVSSPLCMAFLCSHLSMAFLCLLYGIPVSPLSKAFLRPLYFFSLMESCSFTIQATVWFFLSGNLISICGEPLLFQALCSTLGWWWMSRWETLVFWASWILRMEICHTQEHWLEARCCALLCVQSRQALLLYSKGAQHVSDAGLVNSFLLQLDKMELREKAQTLV